MICDVRLQICRRAQKAEPYRLTGAPAALAIESKEHGRQPGSFIAGFVKGADAAPLAVFPAPKVPASYQPIHKFPEPMRTGGTFPSLQAPPLFSMSGLEARLVKVCDCVSGASSSFVLWLLTCTEAQVVGYTI